MVTYVLIMFHTSSLNKCPHELLDLIVKERSNAARAVGEATFTGINPAKSMRYRNKTLLLTTLFSGAPLEQSAHYKGIDLTVNDYFQ
jgi:hypothetical protein